jgi:hypothetical protein
MYCKVETETYLLNAGREMLELIEKKILAFKWKMFFKRLNLLSFFINLHFSKQFFEV